MSHVLLAHAPNAEARAAFVAEHLGALGFEVRQESGPPALSPRARAALKAKIEAASCVLVLWSRDAMDDAALIAATQQARAAGKLALARLDTTPAPRGAPGADLSQWKGRRDARSWRGLLAALAPLAQPKANAPSPPAAPHRPGPAMLGLGFLVVFGVLLAAAALLT